MSKDSATSVFTDSDNRRIWLWASALLVSMTVLTGFLFREAAAFTAQTWWDSETYAHGVIILPISLWMFWQRKHLIVPVTPHATYWGLLPVLLLSLLWVPGFLSNVWLVQQVSLILMVPALAFALFGVATTRAMMFPLAYLAFAIPIGDSLIEPLMDYTAVFSVAALQLTGIPVYQEGYFISIPSGNFHVAEACSGVRYLIASLALGCLYAYLSYRVWWRRLLFIVLAAIVPIVANGIRAYAIIMIAHLSDMKLAVGVDHLIFGWVFFGIVMFFLFWLGSLWQEPLEQVEAIEAETRPVAAQAGAMSRLWLVALMLIPVLVSGSLMGRWISAEVQQNLVELNQSHSIPTPTAAGGWQLAEVQPDPKGDWQPQQLGKPATILAAYEQEPATEQVLVYMAHYAEQKDGAELINSGNRIFRPLSWRQISSAEQAFDLPDGSTLMLKEWALRSGYQHRVIWSWYVINDVDVINPFYVKWLEALAMLQGQPGAGVIAVAADYELREEEARVTLRAFLDDMYPSLKSSMRQAETPAGAER